MGEGITQQRARDSARERDNAAARTRAGSEERQSLAGLVVMSAQTPAMPSSSAMPARAAALILDAFLVYNARFSDITRRAKRWFERRNWKQAQSDLVWRMDLYDECLLETLGRLEVLLDDRIRARSLWAATRDEFQTLVEPLLDRE